MSNRIITPYEALYSVVNTYTPQCSDLTEETVRLKRRTKFTTIKTNEPEYLYHGRPDDEQQLHRVQKGNKPWGTKHVCEECAPLPTNHPDVKGSHRNTPKKYRKDVPPIAEMRTRIDTSQLTERLQLIKRRRKRLPRPPAGA